MSTELSKSVESAITGRAGVLMSDVTALARKWYAEYAQIGSKLSIHDTIVAAVREALAPPKDSSGAILAWLVRAAHDEALREALEMAEERLRACEAGDGHDRDYYFGYEQALSDAIAALRGGTG